MEFEVYDFIIPVWAVCAIEYGDFSGLTDEEEAQIEKFLNKNALFNAAFEYGDETFFTYYNDICSKYGADCIEARAYVPKN